MWRSFMAAVGMAAAMWAGGARAERVVIPLADGTQLQAGLFVPQAASVAPAMVLLHGCGGPYPARDSQWRDLFLSQGHVVLMPDSFASRGLRSQCRVAMRDRVATSAGLRRGDAIASAAWLAARPGTPAGGVVLMGWSDGGSTVMAAASAAPDLPAHLIRGLIAFYPGCAAAKKPGWTPVAPMLIQMGEADDWTPAKPCAEVAARFAPSVLTMTAYPGAYHDFDAPGGLRVMQSVPSSQNADKTVHAGTDPQAREAALLRVPAFLASLPPVD